MLSRSILSKRAACPACRLFSTASNLALSSEFPSASTLSSPQQNGTESIIFTSPVYNTSSSTTDRRSLRYHRRSLMDQDTDKRRVEKDDPYQAMLDSPMRQCIVTRQKLPSAFMINLRPTYFPPTAADETSSPSLKLLPDRIITRGRTKKGKGAWVTCNEGIIAGLKSKKGPHIGFLRHYPSITIAENIQSIIHNQLLERIKIEFENLSNTLNSLSPRRQRQSTTSEDRSASAGELRCKPIMRRLSDTEVSSIPGLSPDGVSAHPHSEGIQFQLSSENTNQGEIIALLDISNLSPPASKSSIQDGPYSPKVDIPLIPIHDKSIPLYTLSTLFPSSLHAELNSQIKKVLSIERRSKRRSILSLGLVPNPAAPREKYDHSDIVALYNYPSTENRRGVSGVPLAVALWRIRCFLGYGWE